jgi:hypothetical protein
MCRGRECVWFRSHRDPCWSWNCLINQIRSGHGVYQQDLINTNHLSTRPFQQRHVCVCVCQWVSRLCVCVCGGGCTLCWSSQMIQGSCLVHIRDRPIMVVSTNFPWKSVCTSPTRLEDHFGDTEVEGTVRYCLPEPFGPSRETLPDVVPTTSEGQLTNFDNSTGLRTTGPGSHTTLDLTHVGNSLGRMSY